MKAYILAGGYSKRFGKDKTLFRIFSKPLILEVFEKTAPYFDTYVITKQPEKYKKLNLPLIRDAFDNLQSPLIGIYTGLIHSESEFNLFLSADLPLLDERYLDFVKNYPYDGSYLGYIPILEGKFHFTCGVYSKELLPFLEEAISKNTLSLKQFSKFFHFWDEVFLTQHGISRYTCFNLNRRENLKELESIYKALPKTKIEDR